MQREIIQHITFLPKKQERNCKLLLQAGNTGQQCCLILMTLPQLHLGLVRALIGQLHGDVLQL